MAPIRKTVRAVTLGTAIAVGALALLAAPTAASASAPASAGHMIPAVGVGPHFKSAGTARGSDITFPCQTTSPAQCYGPKQIRHAYGYDKLLAKGIDGRGSTIVIVDAFSAPSIRTDLHNFDQAFGLKDPKLNIIAPQGLTKFDYNDPNQVGWSAEISLDVEWAHAIAPKATIDLVLAKSNDDRDIAKALKYVADKGLGDVVSQSYGEAEQCSLVNLKAQHEIFAKMNRNGTTVFASAGDEGAAEPSCDGSTWVKAASTPASDPAVTGVGGTALYANGKTGAYQSETVWNEPDYAVAGGSGLSSVFTEPSFQRSVQHTGKRSVPDVSYNGAVNEGVIVAWSEAGGSGLFYVFGGTSAGSPQWAATAALAKQQAGHRLGNINPWLYHLTSEVGVSKLFHDITKGNTSVVEADANNHPVSITGVSARKGWDFATGFGSPKANVLVPFLGGDD